MGLKQLSELEREDRDNGDGGGWKPLEKARYYWLLLKRMHGDPGILARGVALGTFVGITPTIPLHTLSIVCLSPLLKASPLSAIIASIIVSNPLTIPLEYYAAWKVGTLITGFRIPWAEVSSLLDQVEHTDIWHACLFIIHKSFKLIEAMLVGGFVLAIPAAIAAYFMAHHFYIRRIARKNAEAKKKDTDAGPKL